ncbi:MAG: WD40/YVTN/BNR-like repeat-containing protein [Actinomycetota bacterium]
MTTVLVGTSKGLFILRGDREGGWSSDGPALRGQMVDAVAADARGGAIRLLAGAYAEQWGPSLLHSDDVGQTWSEPDKGALRFPDDTDAALVRVWQVLPGRDDEPGVVWAGVEPAALFRSTDAGETFELVRGLWDHPHRATWTPGGGGLGLHSIVRHPTDPSRMWVAISTGGVYRTADGGTTWEPANRGIRADFLPGPEPEYGQCVHKIDAHPDEPETLFAQNHGGVYRSDDGGTLWHDIAPGLPSDFGFPLVVDPERPGTAMVIPLASDEYRCTAGGRCRVFRTHDGGRSWEPLGEGLPQRNAHLTILRDGFNAGAGGLWFGTRSGEVFGSVDGGDHWFEVARHLPPVLCVRACG